METEESEKTVETEETRKFNPEHGAVAGGDAERGRTLTEAGEVEIAAGGGRVTLASSARVDDATVEEVAITASSTAPENVGDVAEVDGSEIVEDVTAGGAAGDALETTGGVSEEIVEVESAAAAAGDERKAARGADMNVVEDVAAGGARRAAGEQATALAPWRAVGDEDGSERAEIEYGAGETDTRWEIPSRRKTVRPREAVTEPFESVMANPFEGLGRWQSEPVRNALATEGGVGQNLAGAHEGPSSTPLCSPLQRHRGGEGVAVRPVRHRHLGPHPRYSFLQAREGRLLGPCRSASPAFQTRQEVVPPCQGGRRGAAHPAASRSTSRPHQGGAGGSCAPPSVRRR